jgi:hypothetical protein
MASKTLFSLFFPRPPKAEDSALSSALEYAPSSSSLVASTLLGVCFVAEDPKEREHLRQILSGAAPKLSLIKLRHNDRSQDDGVNRLKDEMTERPMMFCVIIVIDCKEHKCNFTQVVPYAYK